MLNKLKTIRKDSGFTIVELLIVIVVIGILAAITIVSYTGITQKANTTKAQTNAVAVQKVAETYFAEVGTYPDTKTKFTGASASLPAGVTFLATGTELSASNGKDSVIYEVNADESAARITYFDFGTNAAVTPMVIGTPGSSPVWTRVANT